MHTSILNKTYTSIYAVQNTHKILKQISTEQKQTKNKRFMHLSKQKIKKNKKT